MYNIYYANPEGLPPYTRITNLQTSPLPENHT
jgi:hypothetical protein